MKCKKEGKKEIKRKKTDPNKLEGLFTLHACFIQICHISENMTSFLDLLADIMYSETKTLTREEIEVAS